MILPPPASPVKSPIKPLPSPLPDQSAATHPPPEATINLIDKNGHEHVDIVSNGIDNGHNSIDATPVKPDNHVPVKPDSIPVKPVFKSPKTPRTPLTPLSAEVSLKPEDYRYIVRRSNSDELLEVKGEELYRQKGVFTTTKLKLLLRSVLYRKSDKHPFAVKVSGVVCGGWVRWCMCACACLNVFVILDYSVCILKSLPCNLINCYTNPPCSTNKHG